MAVMAFIYLSIVKNVYKILNYKDSKDIKRRLIKNENKYLQFNIVSFIIDCLQ